MSASTAVADAEDSASVAAITAVQSVATVSAVSRSAEQTGVTTITTGAAVFHLVIGAGTASVAVAAVAEHQAAVTAVTAGTTLREVPSRSTEPTAATVTGDERVTSGAPGPRCPPETADIGHRNSTVASIPPGATVAQKPGAPAVSTVAAVPGIGKSGGVAICLTTLAAGTPVACEKPAGTPGSTPPCDQFTDLTAHRPLARR